MRKFCFLFSLLKFIIVQSNGQQTYDIFFTGNIADSSEIKLYQYENYHLGAKTTITNLKKEVKSKHFQGETERFHILFFSCLGQNFKILVEPGSIISVNIQSKDSIKVSGSNSIENQLYHSLTGQKDILVFPKFNKDGLNEKVQVLDSIILEKQIKLGELKDKMKDEYVEFLHSEIYGFYYYILSNLLYPYENGDLKIIPEIENTYTLNKARLNHFKINKLGVNSRFYMNALSVYFRRKEYKNYQASEFFTQRLLHIEKLFRNYPEFREWFMLTGVNTIIYKATSIEDLGIAQKILDEVEYLKINYPESFKVLHAELKSKTEELNKTKLVNYQIENEKGKIRDIISSSAAFTLLDFWASWCGPCLKSMPKTINLANQYNEKLDVKLINVSDAKTKFDDILAKLKNVDLGKFYFLDEPTSELIRSSYLIDALPNYIILDKESNVMFRSNSIEDVEKKFKFLLD